MKTIGLVILCFLSGTIAGFIMCPFIPLWKSILITLLIGVNLKTFECLYDDVVKELG
jgi:hypothetical protein